MIEATEIWKSYGRLAALRGVSFRVEPGQVAGLLGPNGAGKSSTIRILTGFRPPDAGRARVHNADVVQQPHAARKAVGYLPESAPLYEEMTVRDFLLYRSRLFGLGFRGSRTATARALDRTALAHVQKRRIAHLSKGYRQRVGLAAALLHDPPVIILDEPTNGLDPHQVIELRALIRELARNRTMLISSHVLSEVERVCDRVVMLVAGRVRAAGAPSELLADAERSLALPYALEAQPGPSGAPAPAAAVAELRDRVCRVPGVRAAEIEPLPGESDWVRLKIGVEVGAGDLRVALAEAARPALVRELSREPVRLEDLFLHLTREPAEDNSEDQAA